MIYVSIEGVKSEERGRAGGNSWHDTDDVMEAISEAFEQFSVMWAEMGHGPAVTFVVTVAPETSPRRTSDAIGRGGRPLPVIDR